MVPKSTMLEKFSGFYVVYVGSQLNLDLTCHAPMVYIISTIFGRVREYARSLSSWEASTAGSKKEPSIKHGWRRDVEIQATRRVVDPVPAAASWSHLAIES